jgi:hypothetical protein
MYAELTYKNKKISNAASYYQPSDKEKKAIAMVQKDWQLGLQNQNKSRTEYNDRSILTEIDVNQRAFNSYVPPKSNDPDLSWRAQTVRPITRNKLISIAAHVTATVLYPAVFAQNADDEEDKDSAQVMGDLMEWVINNSNYTRSFITAVIGMLVDPYVVVHVDFYEVMRMVKEMKEDGTWTEKEILDEVISGFCTNVIPAKEIMFANFYEPNIQRQRFMARQKYIDHAEASLIYANSSNFKYVKCGVRAIFDEGTKTFYDVVDDDARGMFVHEVTYWNRKMDLELIFLNGILMCAPDQPNKRKDKKYPLAHGGFEPLGNGQSFCFKSAANKLGSDQDIVDTLYNMIIDGTFMALMPPMALYGSESVDSSVFIPGQVTEFKDVNTKFENIGPRVDLRAGLETIAGVERSMSESGGDPSRAGNAQGGDRTAREVLLLEKNAQIALGLFGKMIRFLVEDLGDLMIGDILQHFTVGQAMEISDGLKFQSFLLPDKNINGKNVTKKLQFVNPADFPEDKTYKDKLNTSFSVMDKEGGYDSKKKLYIINPEIFRERKFKTRIVADEFNPPSKALEKALNLELFDRAINLPNVDQDAVVREFLFDSYRPGQADRFMKKIQPVNPMEKASEKGIGNNGTNTSMLSQITGSNSLGIAASSE